MSLVFKVRLSVYLYPGVRQLARKLVRLAGIADAGEERGSRTVSDGKEEDRMSAVLEDLYTQTRRVVRKADRAKLPVVDPTNPDPDDLFAFGKAIAERAHFTQQDYEAALRFAREDEKSRP